MVSRRSLLATLVLALVAAPPAGAATYQSVTRSVFVKMSDGVELAGTLDLPSLDGKTVAPGRFPVVLTLTPYGRTYVFTRDDRVAWARRGYVGAVFDIRGAGGSGGTLDDNYFSPRESRDSAEVIKYLGTRSWSNGRVGMIGGSYEGITQYLAAAQQPPHLKAIVPDMALADLYRDAVYHGGILSQFFGAQYLAVQGVPGLLAPNEPGDLPHTITAKLDQVRSDAIAFDYLESDLDTRFFRERSPIELARQIKVPVLIHAGWFDGLSARGAPEMFRVLRQRQGVETRLWFDPMAHKGNGPPFNLSGYDPPLDSFSQARSEFLARHLEGTPAPGRKRVKLFLMGRDKYIEGEAFPPRGTRAERLFLEPGRTSPAPGRGTSESYFANPAAGYSMSFDRHGTAAISPYIPTDQRTENQQGLVWTSDPLEQPLAIAGPISMHLVASATGADTDWYVRISDVRPDGSVLVLTPGFLRASHRVLDRGRSRPLRPYHPHLATTPVSPGRRVTYAIEIWPTANEWRPGHRIRIQLTSGDNPTHTPGRVTLDRSNPLSSTFSPLPPSTNTVFYGGAGGSSLLLPVIRGSVPEALGGCLERRAPIGPRNIGRVRLRYSRRRLLRIPIRPVRRTRRAYRYCVKGPRGSKRRSRGSVTAVFGRKGRVVLVTTTARGHRMRGVGRGVRTGRLRSRFPRARRLGRGLYRVRSRSRRIFGTRRGRVRFVAVADRRLLRNHRALRRYVRRAMRP